MAVGFSINGTDLDSICEPIRSNHSSNFGGNSGVFIGLGSDLNVRYASYPDGFGYAQYAWSPALSPAPFMKTGSPITPPSLVGYRPTFGKIIDLTATGTWYAWRNGAYLMLRNPSGTESSYHCSEFGLPVAPRNIGFELVGGGGGGGGGNGSRAAGGGGGGGFVAGWVDIPETISYSEGLRLIVGVAGTRGAGGNGSSGWGTKGGDTYIQNSSGTNLYVGYGGEPGKNSNDGAEYGVGGGTSVPGGNVFSGGNVAGARGGKDGGENGLSVSLTYALRPEEARSYSFAGGYAPASPGAGGASGAGVGGDAGGSGKGGYAPASGYGGGGGGGNYKWFDGFSGGYGAAGRIRLFY